MENDRREIQRETSQGREMIQQIESMEGEKQELFGKIRNLEEDNIRLMK